MEARPNLNTVKYVFVPFLEHCGDTSDLVGLNQTSLICRRILTGATELTTSGGLCEFGCHVSITLKLVTICYPFINSFHIFISARFLFESYS